MRLLIICITALSLVACAQPKTDTAVEAREAFEIYVAAINSGDIETAAAIYDDAGGFHWIERGGIQYEKGSDAAASLRAISQSDGKARMAVDDVRVAEMGEDGALVSGHFDYEMLNTDGLEQFAFDGWMTVGMVRRADGWKIAGGQTGPGRSAAGAGN